MQQEVSLGVGETHTSPEGPRITFVRVAEDSRCPTGVTCIWEGDALVELEIRGEDGGAETVTLHANPQFAQEATAHGLRVRLERLVPHPTADAPVAPDAYRVHLSILQPAAPAA